jgi:hypothetical protein
MRSSLFLGLAAAAAICFSLAVGVTPAGVVVSLFLLGAFAVTQLHAASAVLTRAGSEQRNHERRNCA